MTLAHEFGHFLSWKERTPREVWQRYFLAAKARDEVWDNVSEPGNQKQFDEQVRSAAQAALSPDRIDMIVREEELAWVLGREALEALGFEDFAYYHGRERHGLHCHRYRLGLDELWETDSLPPNPLQ